MTGTAHQVLPADRRTNSTEDGWLALEPDTNEIVSRDHDPAIARLKAVESGVLRPILLGAKSAGVTMRGAITVRKK
jgi:hypothetical protein